MRTLPAHLRCPNCQGPLAPTQLRCSPCDLTLTAHFHLNEFASLPDDDLHFLRLFLLTDGRIKDMEAALGVSYPTIKARLAKLKASLGITSDPPTAPPVQADPAARATAATLEDLQSGAISFDQAMARIKATQTGEAP